jgi:hypothetical protein
MPHAPTNREIPINSCATSALGKSAASMPWSCIRCFSPDITLLLLLLLVLGCCSAAVASPCIAGKARQRGLSVYSQLANFAAVNLGVVVVLQRSGTLLPSLLFDEKKKFLYLYWGGQPMGLTTYTRDGDVVVITMVRCEGSRRAM